MLKTKLFTAIALVAALLLLVPAAYALETGTAAGSFGAKSQPPTVDAIQIYNNEACTIPTTAMDPGTEYYVLVTVSSKSKLKYLSTVKVTLFFDSGGDPVAPTTPDTQTCAILTCTVAPLGWTLQSDAPTTWAKNDTKCSQPGNLEAKTGDWKFAFTPGKVATESIAPTNYWDAQGLATNKSVPAQTGERYDRDTAMNWYGGVTVAGAADWGDVDSGLIFSDEGNSRETGISTTYIANGNYEENVNSGDWDSGGEPVVLRDWSDNALPPDADGQFALKANDINELASAITVFTDYRDIDATGTQTGETGETIATNTLWLSLSAEGILPGTYTGSIFYQIANR